MGGVNVADYLYLQVTVYQITALFVHGICLKQLRILSCHTVLIFESNPLNLFSHLSTKQSKPLECLLSVVHVLK